MSGFDPAARAIATQNHLDLARMQVRGLPCIIGDSINAGGYAGTAAAGRALARSGRYRPVANLAVGGTRSDQILAVQLPAAIATGASSCIVNGGTNDIEQGVTSATMRANLIAIWSQLRASGVEPIDLGLLPRTGNAGFALTRANEQVWRQFYTSRAGIPHVNAWPLLAAADGSYQAALAHDAIHPNSSAANLIADALVERLQRPQEIAPPLELIDRAAGSGTVLANAVSFGGPAAALPAGYFTVGSGATYAVQPADAGDFGGWLRASFAGTTSGAYVGFQGTARSLADLGIGIGDRIAFTARLRWSGAGAAMKLRILFTGASMAAGSQPMYDEIGGSAGEASWTVQYVGTVASGSNLGISFTANTTAAGWFELNRPLIYNLTRNGL